MTSGAYSATWKRLRSKRLYVTGTTPAPGDRQIHLQYNLA